VIGITVPTRSYAAAFCTLGVAFATYVAKDLADVREHFEWLASLPEDTPIRFRAGHFLKSGRLLGVESVKGVDYIRIGSEGIYKRPWDKCLDIQLLEPGSEFTHPRRLAANPEFVEACAPGIDALTRASFTVLDGVLVGMKSVLEREILDEEFICPYDAPMPKCGVLNDLLRCDAFERNPNDHDRITVVSSLASDLPPMLGTAAPPAVVLDGSSAYLRLRRKWKGCPLIAIFDRTSSSSPAGADAFNQEYALSIADVDISFLGTPPPDFEVVAYSEVVR
jgi:hypothetical protein